jgi:tetratricopeptide (TPR) repeat protein
VSGPSDDPAALLEAVVAAVVAELELDLSPEDEAQVTAVVAQTPSLASLGAVGEAALGLEARDTPELQAAAERDPDSSWVLSERAEALAAAGELEPALAASLAAIQAAPEDVEALVKRGVVLAAAGDAETARQAFEAALALNRTHAVALAGSARFAATPEAAQAALTQALRAYPRYTAVYLERAALQRQTGDLEGALATLREAVARVPESASLHAALIGELVRRGEEAEALTVLEARLAADADPDPSIYALATELAPSQRARALAILREGRERHPQDAALALAEAEVLRAGGDFEAAEGVLREALAAAPNHPELANQLAITQAQAGNTDAARATLEAAVTQHPQARAVLERNLAQLLLEAGQNEAAVEVLEPLLARTPEDAELYTLYGLALGGMGRFDQALNALDEALRLAPGSSDAQNARRLVEQNQNLSGSERLAFDPDVAAVFGAGLSALQADELQTAQREFDRAAELQAETAGAGGAETGTLAFYQGYARQLQGDLRGAVDHYERALEHLSESATVLNNAGFAYFRLGRFDRALDYLTRATQADPGNSEAQLNLGLVLFDLGRFEQAVAPLERALAGNPALAELRVDPGDGEPLLLPELVERARRAVNAR